MQLVEATCSKPVDNLLKPVEVLIINLQQACWHMQMHCNNNLLLQDVNKLVAICVLHSSNKINIKFA